MADIGTSAGSSPVWRLRRLHGAEWVDDDAPIEILVDERRRQSGLVVRIDRLADDEITTVARSSGDDTARTAFDLGRYQKRSRCDRPVATR